MRVKNMAKGGMDWRTVNMNYMMTLMMVVIVFRSTCFKTQDSEEGALQLAVCE